MFNYNYKDCWLKRWVLAVTQSDFIDEIKLCTK